MRGFEERAAAIARARRADQQVSRLPSPRTSTADGIPANVTAKLRGLIQRVPPAQRAAFGRRLLTVWQASGRMSTAGELPSAGEARAALELVTALDEAGAFDD